VTKAASDQRLAWADHFFDDAEQESGMGSFLIESVGGNSLGEINA
jgi:hypothetical protein